jgi:hypothetical protein
MMSIEKGTCWRVNNWRVARQAILLFALASTSVASAATAGQKSYASPEKAVAALADAIKSGNNVKLSAILGPHGSKLISSGDAVADARGRTAFARSFGEANKIVLEGEAQATLVIGKDEWPFPIPLVKSNNTWKFDTEQGEQEVLNRRIGRNELAAIQVCLAIVDAEREYAALHGGTGSVPEYAARIVSSEDKHDGLYWPTGPGEPPSPLGPLVAAAASEGYSSALAPYHGYFYRILAAQGKNAPGGEYAYFIKGRMIGGFAVIAYPARYGASGIKTFVVNHDGVVLEKDLGQDTATVALVINTYDPDSTWQPAETSSRDRQTRLPGQEPRGQ